MDDAIQNMPPRYTHKKKMTPQQIEAKAAYLRKYRREWARANQKKRWARMKERMAVDPEYREKYLEQVRKATAKRRGLGLVKKKDETPEEREKRLQRERDYRAKKRREYRLANPLPTKPPKEEKPEIKVKTEYKRKPGRLLALAGWRGF